MELTARAVSRRLPEFPWDRLNDAKSRAATHPDGIVDLSIGTPVDSTPEVVRRALCAAADWPGYPTTPGTSQLRESAAGWMRRRLGVADPGAILPTIGSKELIAGLAAQLGLDAQSTVVIPRLAYPTYEVGGVLTGATVVASDATTELGPQAPDLLWLNSPSNPTGGVLPAEHLRKVVDWARERGTLVVSDECYIEFVWEGEPATSVLHPSVCGDAPDGILAVHSLAKRSNLAGYRGAFISGDPTIVEELLDVRRNLGMIVPGPQQAAMVAALDDDAHVEAQWERYAARRSKLREAVEAAGFRVDASEGALYLWASRDEPAMDTVNWLAERGILVAPGDFYGADGASHVRIAFTATDERIDAAHRRLTAGE